MTLLIKTLTMSVVSMLKLQNVFESWLVFIYKNKPLSVLIVDVAGASLFSLHHRQPLPPVKHHG
jgi:hypothetical protein